MNTNERANTAIMDRAERTYLLREGHFFGFGAGILLSRWWWAAVAWGTVILALWAWSLYRLPTPSSSVAEPPDEGETQCSIPASGAQNGSDGEAS